MRAVKFLLICFGFLCVLPLTTVSAKPPAPYNVHATTYLPHCVEITWSYNQSGYWFHVYRSKNFSEGYKLIGVTSEPSFNDCSACPTVKPPQNVSATDSFPDQIGITWSDPSLLTPIYFYKIEAKQMEPPFEKSDKSLAAGGHVLDYLDHNSAIITVSDSLYGPYDTLASGLPSPENGATTFWHTGLPPAATRYYRIYVHSLYMHCPSEPSHLMIGKTTGNPPLSLDISGPGCLDWLQEGTWQIIASGGTGNYSYEWQIPSRGLSGSGPIIHAAMNHEDFEIQAQVTDGVSSEQAYLYVQFCGAWPPLP